jgi:Penicillin-insensitive murein endopeptidase
VHVFDSSGWENAMRGDDERSEGFFQMCVWNIAADHPLRSIRELVDRGLLELSPAFDRVYAREGRRLLRALLLQAFYTVRSERQFMEQLDYASRGYRQGVRNIVSDRPADHFPVRLACPAETAECKREPLPPTDKDCGQELVSWIKKAQLVPKTPTAQPPKHLLTLADRSAAGLVRGLQ